MYTVTLFIHKNDARVEPDREYSSVVYRDSPVSLASDFSMLATQDPQVIPVTLRWTSVSPSWPPSSLQDPLLSNGSHGRPLIHLACISDSDYMSCGREGSKEEGIGGEGRGEERRGERGEEKGVEE